VNDSTGSRDQEFLFTDGDFERVRKLIYQHAGISLSDSKRQLVYGRLSRRLRALKNPQGIQRALDAMPYHFAETVWPPRRVLRHGTAHCLEAAIFAATALRILGFPPLLLDLEAVQDLDHVIAVFRLRGGWGAIAKSSHSGLRYREPVYRSLRELAISYFEVYINLRRERTLRAYSRPGTCRIRLAVSRMDGIR
jgi:hypothetical protein